MQLCQIYQQFYNLCSILNLHENWICRPEQRNLLLEAAPREIITEIIKIAFFLGNQTPGLTKLNKNEDWIGSYFNVVHCIGVFTYADSAWEWMDSEQLCLF